MPLVWLALLGLVVWAVIRLSQDRGGSVWQPGAGPGFPTPPGREDSAQDILDRRLATGEIDQETHERLSDQIARRGQRTG